MSMGVYIKGMEMPKNCGQCPFKKLSPTGESMICELTLFTVPWDWKTTDCPLIEIPPHGRLIDADDVLERNEDDYSYFKGQENADYANEVLVRAIHNAPTIISAEEEE